MTGTLCLRVALLFVLGLTHAFAGDTLEVTRVARDVYAIVGELGNRTPANLGNNANFGVVVTAHGVVLIDSGGTLAGAQAIHARIRSITDKPVVMVINTGGQDHRWLGNAYFRGLGAHIVASRAAVADQKARASMQLSALALLVGGQQAEATEPAHAERTFDQALTLEVGGTVFEIRHAGPAHTPGDSFVWLPQTRTVFTGDIVYTERMLGVLEYSNSANWLRAFAEIAALEPAHVVPGHGAPTDLARARQDTLAYLTHLRSAVRELMDGGGDISAVGKIDQSAFKRLLNFDQLAGRNAQRVFAEMEWE